MQEFSTPMMTQYTEIKRKYPDCLMFFRMGDFYELFLDDALIGAKILNITLTKKSGGKDGKIPMAGVPYHAADSYIAKLVKAGHKVAICEQLSPPSKKGLVKRGVVRIITPGTLIDEDSLDKKEHNYIISFLHEQDTIALAVADLSTGYFAVHESDGGTPDTFLKNEISRLAPQECILPDELYNNAGLLTLLSLQQGMNIFPFNQFPDEDQANRMLKKHFGVSTLAGFGVETMLIGQKAAAGLLRYLQETQNGQIPHIRKLSLLSVDDGVALDRSTMLNLELFSTIRDNDPRGSLLTVIDQTITPMGGRLLKTWMKKPLSDKEKITERFDAVSELCEQAAIREEIRERLHRIPDIERIISRLSVHLGNARDLQHLKMALTEVRSIASLLEQTASPLLRAGENDISPKMYDVISIIDTVFVTEPPLTVRDGGMINPSVNKELDLLKSSIQNSREWLMKLEQQERIRTGISSLKVRFNKVFGYYIEISNANLQAVPKDYIRKQTLVNGERFITPELKDHEERIFTAEEKINDLEYTIFSETLNKILHFTSDIQQSSQSIAVTDCLVNFSLIAEKYRYVRPKLLYSGEMRIQQGRHPVVERLTVQTAFVPNDAHLDNITQSLLVITGPNMAGKSVFIRQVALIVYMAQIGCFVPAETAHISIVDKIFVRSGASDVITSGLSTFMVEMVETAHILNHATEHSLIILDEIGRGTSTYDGISIAWAVAEQLVTGYARPPKVLFATHYHELQELERLHPGKIKNFHMAVTQEDDEPIFLHTILPGGAPHSYGIAVAKLAGIPAPVITRAKELLADLEKTHHQEAIHTYGTTTRTSDLTDRLLQKDLENIDIATMTPLQALNLLALLKEKLSLLKENRFSEKD